MDVIGVELINWKKHQPKRKDVIQNSWFRVYHDIFENEDFWDFGRDELCFFLYLLCQASKQNSSRVKLNIEKAMLIGRFKKQTITNSLKKLEEIKTIKIRRTDDVTDTLRERDDDVPPEKKENKRREEREGDSEVTDSDFDSVWVLYPRKTERGLAKDRYFRIIRNRKDVDDFCTATKNYSAECERLNTEESYIKHMTTFLGTEKKPQPWKDFVNYNPPKSDSRKHMDEWLKRHEKGAAQ